MGARNHGTNSSAPAKRVRKVRIRLFAEIQHDVVITGRTHDYVTVLFDFKAESDTEVDLKKGEILRVLNKPDKSDWWGGERLRDGKVGYFPREFVQECVDSDFVASLSYMRQKLINTKKRHRNHVLDMNQKFKIGIERLKRLHQEKMTERTQKMSRNKEKTWIESLFPVALQGYFSLKKWKICAFLVFYLIVYIVPAFRARRLSNR